MTLLNSFPQITVLGTNNDCTSNANGHEAVNTTRDINATEMPSTNYTPVYVDNGGNASGRVNQNYGGALETSYVNEDGRVESTYNNSAMEQPSANDPPVNNATTANGDDGCNGDFPIVPPDNNATAANASAWGHSYDGGAHETSDEDGHKLVHTIGNFDATEQLPADNCPINNGTAADESPIDDQQETYFSTTPIEPSSANTSPHNYANVANAYTTNNQDNTVVKFEPTETNVEQEGLFARATNSKIDAINNNSVNQTQGTNVNSHELLSSKLTGIFSTINEGQMLDEEVRNLLRIFSTSFTSLHQKLAGVHNQIKKLDRFNMNLKKEMKNNQRPLKRKYDELFGKFNALKQEIAQICQHIHGDGGKRLKDRDFIHSDGSTKTIYSGLINLGWICYANAFFCKWLQVYHSYLCASEQVQIQGCNIMDCTMHSQLL